MPELPEVEHVAQGLRAGVAGAAISQIQIISPAIVKSPLGQAWRQELIACRGLPITAVTRRAKRLIVTLGDRHILIVQLGMTGRFMLHASGQPQAPHTHFALILDDNRRLDFIDPRRFGWLWVMGTVAGDLETAMEQAGFGKLGPEPFRIKPTAFGAILQSDRPIKNLLLDQSRIAGLGNIYADETLFAAGIDPRTVSRAIPPDRADRLRRAIPRILNRSIRNGGTTFSDFHNPYGEPGRFLTLLKVYGRDGQPCRTCGTPIQRLVLSNRSAHFSPFCQHCFR